MSKIVRNPEGQIGEAWRPSRKVMLFRVSVSDKKENWFLLDLKLLSHNWHPHLTV